MKIVVQNLQKKAGLASSLVEKYDPDVLLAQEINLATEENSSFCISLVHNTSKKGYGTAIYGKKGKSALSNVKNVDSPHAEFGGFIRKKTIVATYMNEEANSVQFVSFHGYNGQPFKDASKLKDHVDTVLAVLNETGPAVFAGDFNTWTQHHVDAIQRDLEKAGFRRAFSWPYPGRNIPLDHAFLRGVQLESATPFSNQSDHHGAVLDVNVNCL
jgi:endonuclease/exonuclease/phosphatase (EEP) superfamily protein YafD